VTSFKVSTKKQRVQFFLFFYGSIMRPRY